MFACLRRGVETLVDIPRSVLTEVSDRPCVDAGVLSTRMRGQRFDELARVIGTDRMKVDRNPELVEPRAKARVFLR